MHEELASLRSRQAVSQAKLEEHKHKIVQLSHKLLNCVALIERARKMDYPLQDEEYTLQRQLEIIYQQLFQPTKLRSQLSELVSQVKIKIQHFLSISCRMSKPKIQSCCGVQNQRREIYFGKLEKRVNTNLFYPQRIITAHYLN